MIAILSGQLQPQFFAGSYFTLGDQIGALELTNHKLCSNPPGPFGTPMHCWKACRGALPCNVLVKNDVFDTLSFEGVGVVQYQYTNWAIGIGPALEIKAAKNEIHF